MKKSIAYLALITYLIFAHGSCYQPKQKTPCHLRFLYNSRIGSFIRSGITKKWFSSLSGWYCDRAISKYHIPSFAKTHNIDLSETIKEPQEYRSFNDFFTRKLKKEARPIDTDQSSIISPCDGYIIAYNNITNNMEFPIKGVPFNLSACLKNSTLAAEYKDGSLIIIRLGPHNYHWFHAPLEGIPTPSKPIKGTYESVNPIAYHKHIQPLVCNERQLFSFNTKNCDTILMIPVGALCVGKIITTYQPYRLTQKAADLGYFKFGGSTLVMVFKKDTVMINKILLSRSAHGIETEIKMGQKIGIITKKRITL